MLSPNFNQLIPKVNGHFVLAELFLLANFINIFQLYVRLGHKLGRLDRNGFNRLILLEAPVARLPLAVLFIEILHNGAVAFHVHGATGRLLSNIFIWIILVIGGGVVVWFRDWYILSLIRFLIVRVFGLAIAYLTLSLAIKQLAIKVIALQWIFGCYRVLPYADSSLCHLGGGCAFVSLGHYSLYKAVN